MERGSPEDPRQQRPSRQESGPALSGPEIRRVGTKRWVMDVGLGIKHHGKRAWLCQLEFVGISARRWGELGPKIK